MTIQRQYNLPNCTLRLEGMSNNGSPSDSRPLMSMLVNAECRFVGQEQTLSGGRDFLESLVQAVSRYAQECLSGIPYPQQNGHQSAVSLTRLNGNRHRLTVHSAPGNGSAAPTVAQLDLTTVQLFDLVEAVDQLCADAKTLPEIALHLQPVPKKYAKAQEPIARRAMPAAVGVSSLALAAVAFALLPIPEVRRPTPAGQNAVTQTQEGTTNNGTQPPPVSDLENTLTTVPAITDPAKIEALQAQLSEQVDEAWQEETPAGEDLVYRVAVGEDGAILGYKAENAAAQTATTTPLKNLVYIPPSGGVASAESLAQFRLVLTNAGGVEVTPWQGETSENPSSNRPESSNNIIDDPSTVTNLLDGLYTQVNDAWKTTPTFKRELIYRVDVNEAGKIVHYTPINQPAFDYAQEIPLPKLQQPAVGISQTNDGSVTEQSVAQYKVVFTPRGVLQVSPWDGYR